MVSILFLFPSDPWLFMQQNETLKSWLEAVCLEGQDREGAFQFGVSFGLK